MKPPPMQFDLGLTVNKQGKPCLDCQFNVPRLLNTTAALSVDASLSSLIAHSVNVRYTLPLGDRWQFSAEAVKQMTDHIFASSFTEAASGVRLAVSRGTHVFGLDAHLRDILPLVASDAKLMASEQVRRMPLRTIKTSFNYKFTIDSVVRKSAAIAHPIGGSRLSVNADLSGLFGDVSAFKLDSSWTSHRQLPFGSFVWHSRIGGGLIAPLRRSPTPIQDRFFLGGTNEESSCFRGFAMGSMGPSGKRVVVGNPKKGDKLFDHLGGDVYMCLDNSLSFPLYCKDNLDIRGIVFAQVASLVPALHSRVAHDITKNVRASIGLGVAVPIGGLGTLELSLGKPVYGFALSDYSQMLQIAIRISNMQR